MSSLEHGRFCQEVVNQTGLLVATLEGAELSATVPTAPDWSLSDLARHVGGNLRSVEQAVRTGEPVTDPEGQVEEHGGPSGGDPAPLFAWLTEAAGRFASTLGAAGPAVEAQVWTVRWPTAAWARRAAHDLLVHRADAAGTVGAAFTAAPDLAADALDEFLDLMSNPQVAAAAAEAAGPPPAGPTGSVHLHATDTGPEVPSEWLIELGSPPSPGATPTKSHRRRPRPSHRRPAGRLPPPPPRRRRHRGPRQPRSPGRLAGADATAVAPVRRSRWVEWSR